jgi:demethylmenaquinone methyltransferase/2-methoxy-6-polyprenyl-1,4-benzoquinol methylase
MDESSLPGYYAARAAEYDRIYAKPERQRDLRAIEQWLPTVFAGRSVLEIACGTGYWTQFIAPVAARVNALDAAAETLRIARSRVPAAHVDFMEGDAYRLPQELAGFEGAFAGFWISHVPRSRVREFLTGLDRALARGAKVVLLDNRYVEGNSTPICETDSGGNTYQLRKLDDGSSYRVLKNFPTQHEMREGLGGLAREIRFHEWEYYWAVEYSTA